MGMQSYTKNGHMNITAALHKGTCDSIHMEWNKVEHILYRTGEASAVLVKVRIS